MPKNTSVTFAIIPGLAEGRANSRHLRRAFEAVGWQATRPELARIIITHSGGVFGIPAKHKAKLFMHINPSYWPDKPLIKSLKELVTYDYRLRKQRHQLIRWTGELIANFVYVFNVKHGLRMARKYFQPVKALGSLPKGRHIFVRNHADSYCDPDALLAATRQRYSCLSIPGDHNDCWRDPEPYVLLATALNKQL